MSAIKGYSVREGYRDFSKLLTRMGGTIRAAGSQ
jgi:hypothetical protein